MASYDGTNKSSAGCAQHLPYWEIKTEHTKNLYNEAMAMASPEAVAFCNPDNYQGPDIEVDASTPVAGTPRRPSRWLGYFSYLR